MRISPRVLCTVACCLAAVSPTTPAGSEPVKQLVIFPFDADPSRLGSEFAETLQMKIRRNRPPFVLVDRFDVEELMGEEPRLRPASPPAKVSGLLRERFGQVHGGIWGRITKQRDSYTAEVCFLDLTHSASELRLHKTFTARGERGLGLVAKQAAEAILGRELNKPVEAGRVPEPNVLGPMISKNPGFETGTDHPEGWDRTDGLTTQWVAGGSPLGKQKGKKCIRLFTLLPQTQADEWWAKWRAGAKAKDAPAPLPAHPPYYDTVGGLHGAHYYSDYVPIKPGMRYRISADVKAKTNDFFFPKAFVKGYALVRPTTRETKPQRREVWRTYLACRNFENVWKHYSEVFTPTSPSPNLRVKWIRIILYAYWPPGEFFFDNVKVTEEPLR